MDQLLFFNYDRDEFKVGTTFHTRVIDTKNFCETALTRDCFQRGDYKALCELLVIYLGGHVPGFQFKQPGAHHHARFMADCLYLLTMQLTSKINSKLNKSEKDMLQMSTDFIVTFYGSYFLKSPIAAQAPSNDLDAFKLSLEMMSNELYKSKYGPLAKKLHSSLVRHSWYLTPQLLILSIANGDLDSKERAEIALKLISFDPPSLDEFSTEQPDSPTHILPMSVLSDFVTEESWLIFTYLGISREMIKTWIDDNFNVSNVSYTNFQNQVANLAVVNDRAERHIRLVQDFVAQTHDEGLLQDTMQVVTKNRKEVGKDMKKTDFM